MPAAMMTARRTLQLADVSRPAVKTEGAQRVGREGPVGLGVLDRAFVP